MTTEFDPRQVYDGVAARYHKATAQFWDHVAEKGIHLARLQPGHEVLDVACGPGGFAIRAADQVGPAGSVIAMDVSPEMLAITERRAADKGVKVILRPDDMDALAYHPDRFDVITCGFGLFFATDPGETVKRMWQILKPGGRLVIVTLTSQFFVPLFPVYLEAAARKAGRDLDHLVPWRKTEDPAVMREHFRNAGAPAPHTECDDTLLVMDGHRTWDDIARATGIDRITTEIGEEAAAIAHSAVHDHIVTEGIEAMHIGALYTWADKPTR